MLLSDLIKEELIVTNLNCENQIEAFNILYGDLYKNGYVKESYLEGVLSREKVYPTGINLETDYNVAIPHTDAPHVLKSAICLAVLDNPVEFKCMDDPEKSIKVNAIFMIALNEQGKQVRVLEELVSVFTNQEFMKELLSKNKKWEIVKLFKENFDK